MRLEMATYCVKDIRFSSQTRLEGGVLSVAREALRTLLLEGGDFADVGLEIVRPGDPARLIHVMDAVEPRWKAEGGSSFPGMVGPPEPVGAGRTHRLAGMAVVSVGPPVAGEPTYWREAIVDMSGPGAAVTPLGSTLNLVLHFRPAEGYLDERQPEAELHNLMVGSPLAQRYNRRVREAQLKAAAYLASATAGLEPDSVRVYELAPPRAPLPRIVYLLQMNGMVLYGQATESMAPRTLHPNELLDGALLNIRSNAHASYRSSSYLNQRHAVVEELYARHATDLDFAGVIVYPAAADDLARKEEMAERVVALVRGLGAQGAVSSYSGGGHPCIEFMLIAQKCERAGIATIQLMPESYGTPDDPGFVHFVPEAVAIVSTGRSTQEVELPAMARVLGGEAFFDLPFSPDDRLKVPYRYLYGSATNTGAGLLTARQY